MAYRHQHHQVDQKSLDDDECMVVVVVKQRNAGGDMDDDDSSSTASLAWSSTCSYDADCERSSMNDFHSMENHHHHHGGSCDNMLHHHLFGGSSTAASIHHQHHAAAAAVHIPAHVQLVLMTNPWSSSLPSTPPTTTLQTADVLVSTTHDSATISTTKASANAARRHRLFRRRRQGRQGVVGGNSINKPGRFIVRCRKSTSSSSSSSSSSLSSMESQENDDTPQTEEDLSITISTTTPRSCSSPAVQVVEWAQEWTNQELAVDAEQVKDDDDDDNNNNNNNNNNNSHINETDDDACSSTIPRQVTLAVLDNEEEEESDLEDESTTTSTGVGQQQHAHAMVGTTVVFTSPFQLALATFCSQFERPPTSTTTLNSSDDDDDDDDSLSMDDSSEKPKIGHHENDVLARPEIDDDQTEISEEESSDDDYYFTVGEQQDNDDTSRTLTVTTALVEHCHDDMQQESSSKRNVQQPVTFLESTTPELLVGPLVGLHVGLLVVESSSENNQKDDGNANLLEFTKITKGEAPVLADKIESTTRQQIPSIHINLGEMSSAGDKTSRADDESSVARGMFDGIWTWMGRSLFSLVSTSTLGIQENDSNQDDNDDSDDDSADKSVPFQVAEAVLAEADDSCVDMQGHDNCPPGFNTAPPNLASVSATGYSSSTSSSPTRERDDHMTGGAMVIINHKTFPLPYSLERLIKDMSVNRWHGKWKNITIEGSAFVVLPQPYGQYCLLSAVLNMKEPSTLILSGHYSCGTSGQMTLCSSLWSDQVLRTNHRHFRPLTEKIRYLAFGGFNIKSYANASDLAFSFRRLLVWNHSLHLKTLRLGPFRPAFPVYHPSGALDPFLRLMAELKHVPKLALEGFGDGGQLVGHAALGELIHSRCTEPGMLGPIFSTICLTGLGLDDGHCRHCQCVGCSSNVD